MIKEAPQGFYIVIDGKRIGFWRSYGEAKAGLQTERRRIAKRNAAQ